MPRTSYSLSQLATGLIVPLLVLGILGAGYFLFLPRYKSMKDAKARVKEKQEEVADRQSQLASIRKLVQDLKDNRSKLAPINEAIPDAPRIPELLGNIDHLAKQTGILILSLSITGPGRPGAAGGEPAEVKDAEKILAATSNLAIIKVDLRLRGKLNAIEALIANLENNLRLFDIQTLLMGEVDKESGLQEYSIILQTYYQK